LAKLTEFKRSQWTQRNTFVHGDTPKPKKAKNNGVKGKRKQLRKQNPDLIKEKKNSTQSTDDTEVQISKKTKETHQFPIEVFQRIAPPSLNTTVNVLPIEAEIQQPYEEIITLEEDDQSNSHWQGTNDPGNYHKHRR
jgi:hypothetical protein